MEAELLGFKAGSLCGLKKFDEAIAAATEQKDAAMERYQRNLWSSEAGPVLLGYQSLINAWTRKAGASHFGKRKDAMEHQKQVCAEAIAFAKEVMEADQKSDHTMIWIMIRRFQEASF